MDLQQRGSLEIDQDMDFQKKEWSVEKFGWIFMLVLAVLALLGLFGQGPLSSARAESGPVQIKYGRFERLLAPAQFEILLGQQAIQNGEARLKVAKNLIDYYEVERIAPQPDNEELTEQYVTYVFKVPGGGNNLSILFDLKSNKIGPAKGDIGVEGSMIELNQFIYP